MNTLSLKTSDKQPSNLCEGSVVMIGRIVERTKGIFE